MLRVLVVGTGGPCDQALVRKLSADSGVSHARPIACSVSAAVAAAQSEQEGIATRKSEHARLVEAHAAALKQFAVDVADHAGKVAAHAEMVKNSKADGESAMDGDVGVGEGGECASSAPPAPPTAPTPPADHQKERLLVVVLGSASAALYGAGHEHGHELDPDHGSGSEEEGVVERVLREVPDAAVFAPSTRASRVGLRDAASQAWTKRLLWGAGVPTPRARAFGHTEYEAARKFLKGHYHVRNIATDATAAGTLVDIAGAGAGAGAKTGAGAAPLAGTDIVMTMATPVSV